MQPESSAQPDLTSQKRKSRQNLILAILSLFLTASIPISAVFGSQASFGKLSDFPEYYASMKMVLSGNADKIYVLDDLFAQEHLYFPQLEGRGLAYYIPPFCTVLLLPIALLDARTSYLVFISLSFLALSSGSIITGKLFKLKASGICWFLAILFATGPTFESLKIAQLAPFLYLSLSAFLFFEQKNKPVSAAACLSILLLKPQELLPLLVYMLGAGRFRTLIAFTFFALLLCVLSFFCVGQAGFLSYLELLKDSATNTQFMQPELSATVRGQLLRFAEPGNTLANSLSAAILAMALAFIAYAGRKKGRGKDYLPGLSTVALPLGLLSALHCHDYDLLLAAPWLLAYFLVPAKTILQKLNLVFVLVLIASFTVPFYIPIHYNWLMKEQQAINPIFVFFLLSCILSCIQFMRNSRNPEPAAFPDTCPTGESDPAS